MKRSLGGQGVARGARGARHQAPGGGGRAEPRFGLPWPVSSDDVADAMLEIDHLGRTLL